MSAKLNEKEQKPIQNFKYRNIQKDFTTFNPVETVTKEFHLELTGECSTKIVEDRSVDWVERHNKDVSSVGLRNVFAMAERGKINLASCKFVDSEAVDTTMLDPMNPQALKKTLDSKEPSEKLKQLATSLGLSVDQLVTAVVQGKLDEVIKEKTEVKEEKVDEK